MSMVDFKSRHFEIQEVSNLRLHTYEILTKIDLKSDAKIRINLILGYENECFLLGRYSGM